MSKKVKTISEKIKIIKESQEPGVNIKKLAASWNVTTVSIYAWRKEYLLNGEKGLVLNLKTRGRKKLSDMTDIEQENELLRKKVAKLEKRLDLEKKLNEAIRRYQNKK